MQLVTENSAGQSNLLRMWESEFRIHSRGAYYAQNITRNVQDAVDNVSLLHGEVVLLSQHTTSAVMLVEYEAGVLLDIKRTLEDMTPATDSYAHHIRNVDQNGRAHVLGALFNNSVVVPVKLGKLVLGEYQDIMFMDFQELVKPRSISLRVMGASRG